MKSAATIKDLILIGGGHSHLTVIKQFAMNPVAGLRITLVSDRVYAPYSGMLPGLIAGHYNFDQCHIDLRRLTVFAGTRLIVDKVVNIDPQAKTICFQDRPALPYDVLSINIGSTPAVASDIGNGDRSVSVKPIHQFLGKWQQMVDRALHDERASSIAVVGGGAGGVEVILAMQYRLLKLLNESKFTTKNLVFHLFTDKAEILANHHSSVRKRFHKILTQRGVLIHTGHRIASARAGLLKDQTGEEFQVDDVVWVTSASASSWLSDTGLALDSKGFIAVHPSLQSISHADVFATGDIAAVEGFARPKSGVFAVRQGKPLAENLRRSVLQKKLKPFHPQENFLSLITTGDKFAVASRGTLNWALAGRSIWILKRFIDQRFMHQFNELPEVTMVSGEVPPRDKIEAADGANSNDLMRCGGCGAKVGSQVLARVLSRLNFSPAPGVLVATHNADDAAVLKIPDNKLLVQSVDHFRSFIDDPFIFGQVAANHCLGDIYAMGARPHSALAIVTVPYGIAEKIEQQLYEMLAGAAKTMARAGATIIGGHTGEGIETSLGFSVNGLVGDENILRKTGMKTGDVLILTKALGTGSLLAANMRGRATGGWVEECIETMLQSNQAAAECLLRYGATACTDVTGFGLYGHLVEMLDQAKNCVKIDLQSIPVLEGALDTIGLDILSTLHPQNRAVCELAEPPPGTESNQRFQLLFDPQTSGGLIAGISASLAAACIEELIQLGYSQSAIIGSVEATNELHVPILLV